MRGRSSQAGTEPWRRELRPGEQWQAHQWRFGRGLGRSRTSSLPSTFPDDGGQDAGAVLVRALVGAHGIRALVVVADGGADLVDREVVIAGPGLVAPQGRDPA